MDFGDGLNNALESFSEAVSTLITNSDHFSELVASVVAWAGVFLGLWAVWLGIRAILRAARSLR